MLCKYILPNHHYIIIHKYFQFIYIIENIMDEQYDEQFEDYENSGQNFKTKHQNQETQNKFGHGNNEDFSKKRYSEDESGDNKYCEDGFEGEESQKNSFYQNQTQKKNNSKNFRININKNNNRNNKEERKNKQNNSTIEEEMGTGKYSAEVYNKYLRKNVSSYGCDQIHRMNQGMREKIRKFNQILSQIINKNMNMFLKQKNKKPPNKQSQIKILQEEIKNNEKISQRLEQECKKVKHRFQQLQTNAFDEYEGIYLEIQDLTKKIKDKKKQLNSFKFKMSNQSKKLINGSIIIAHPDIHSADVTILKENLIKAKKDCEVNEQKVAYLDKQHSDLENKMQDISDKDKEADIIIQTNKEQLQMHKKCEELLKKKEQLQNYCNRTNSLYVCRQNAIEHENEIFRNRIKNIEYQVKNIESEVTSIFQKSLNSAVKTKRETNKMKATFNRLVEQMKTYNQKHQDPNSTQMKKFYNRKTSHSVVQKNKQQEEYEQKENESNNKSEYQDKFEKVSEGQQCYHSQTNLEGGQEERKSEKQLSREPLAQVKSHHNLEQQAKDEKLEKISNHIIEQQNQIHQTERREQGSQAEFQAYDP